MAYISGVRCPPWLSPEPCRMGVSWPPRNVTLCKSGVYYCYQCADATGWIRRHLRLCANRPARCAFLLPLHCDPSSSPVLFPLIATPGALTVCGYDERRAPGQGGGLTTSARLE